MSEEKHIVETEMVKPVEGKTVMSLTLPKPRWATWMFRTQFVLNKMLTLYLTGTDMVPMKYIKEIMLILACIDLGTWLFAQSMGVKKSDLGLHDEIKP